MAATAIWVARSSMWIKSHLLVPEVNGNVRLPSPARQDHLAKDGAAAQVIPIDIVAAQPSQGGVDLRGHDAHNGFAQGVFGNAVHAERRTGRARGDGALMVADLVHGPHHGDAFATRSSHGPDKGVVFRDILEMCGRVVDKTVAVCKVNARVRAPQALEETVLISLLEHVAHHATNGARRERRRTPCYGHNIEPKVYQRLHHMGADIPVGSGHQNRAHIPIAPLSCIVRVVGPAHACATTG